MKNKICVIGAGSWGTAIASVLAENGYDVYLWAYLESEVDELRSNRENISFLPGYKFSDNIHPSHSLEECLKDCLDICMVVPSHAFRSIFDKVEPLLETGSTVISASKGIENDSMMTMSQIIAARLDKNTKNISIAVLSGPSFAKEVAFKVPTAITMGCTDIDNAKRLQNVFGNDYFRVYASDDVIGLEINGALKNIVAIAAGICDGIGYGLNTRAALITRGLAEITRLGIELGARPQSFSGLSGLGDLILTCTGDLSRNRTVGLKLGQGQKLDAILADMKMVAEGVKTTKSVYDLVKKMDVEMPILEQVYKILYEDKDTSLAVKDLLARELKVE